MTPLLFERNCEQVKRRCVYCVNMMVIAVLDYINMCMHHFAVLQLPKIQLFKSRKLPKAGF